MTCMDHIITYKRGLSGSFRSIRQTLELRTSPRCRQLTLNREKASNYTGLLFILDSPALNCAPSQPHGKIKGSVSNTQFGRRSNKHEKLNFVCKVQRLCVCLCVYVCLYFFFVLALNVLREHLQITETLALRGKVMAHGDRRCEKDKDREKQST